MDRKQRVSKLFDLPLELLLMICGFLREKDIFHFSLVNRQIYGKLDCEWFFDRSTTKPANEALFFAVEHNHFRAVKKAISEGADVNTRQEFCRYTPLMIAAEWGHSDIVSYLLEQSGIAANESAKSGDTALHCAARGGFTDIVRYLLMQSGIDANILDYDNQTALQLASQYGHTDIIEVLNGSCNLPNLGAVL